MSEPGDHGEAFPDDRGGMGFVGDTGERIHLAGDGWALALGIAEQYGWRFDAWPLSDVHEQRAAEIVANRAREVETIRALRDSDEEFADVDDEELDMEDYREEVRNYFFSAAKAAALAEALRAVLDGPAFEALVAAFRGPTRNIVPEEFVCQDLRGRLEAFVAFCRKGGFRLDLDD